MRGLSSLLASLALAGPGAARTYAAHAAVPLHFEPNRGQAAEDLRFVAHAPGLMVGIADREIRLAGSGGSVVMRLAGAEVGAGPAAVGEREGRSNYFRGSDPCAWITGVPHHDRVLWSGIYPGIDLVLHGAGRRLEYDFRLAPGADPELIRLEFDGAVRLEARPDGGLDLVSATGTFHQAAPTVYQEVDGSRSAVAGRFRLGDDCTASFALDAYDPARPLVIDPIVHYSTYLGGSGGDAAHAVALDAAGHVYLAGTTSSPDLAAGAPFQPALAGTANVFVMKLDPSGQRILWATYFGGSTGWIGLGGLALDDAGNAYIAGSTSSTDLPVRNPMVGSLGGYYDAFVAKIDASGSALAYSTYLGGAGPPTNGTHASAIAVDKSGSAYLTGVTRVTTLPLVRPFQSALRGKADAFVAKLDPAGTSLLYSTYLGGNSDRDEAAGIAVDASGAAYVTGTTSSADFPLLNPIIGPQGTPYIGFLTKLAPGGDTLAYSTLLGGSIGEFANAVAVDVTGSATVAGSTYSEDFPTVRPAQARNAGNDDAFIAQLSPAGDRLLFSSYFGGSRMDRAYAVATDALGRVCIAGQTTSSDLPTVAPLKAANLGFDDGFVACLDSTSGATELASYLGGDLDDTSRMSDEMVGVALDGLGGVVVAGTTFDVDFPVVNPIRPSLSGDGDAVLVRFGPFQGRDFAISPARGPNRGRVTVTARCEGPDVFDPAVTLRLKRASSPDIPATVVQVSPTGRSLRAVFELNGAPLGRWDVEAANPGPISWTLTEGFTIEPAREQVWIDVIGPSRMGAQRTSRFQVSWGNRGNVNADGVIAWLGGIPRGASFVVRSPWLEPPALPGQGPLDWPAMTTPIDTGSEILLPIFLPSVPPGVTGKLSFDLTVPAPRTLTLRAWTYLPLGTPPLLGTGRGCLVGLARAEAGRALRERFSRSLPASCASAVGANLDQLLELTQAAWLSRAPSAGNSLSLVQILASLIERAGTCADARFASLPADDIAAHARAALTQMTDTPPLFAECAETALVDARRRRTVEVVGSYDPNAKHGSAGVGPEQWHAGEEPLGYVIHFENLDTATAPAQRVTVTDALDPALVDLATLELGGVGFGDRLLELEPGLSAISTEVDLRPARDLLVRIDGHLDRLTGVLSWTFESIDPTTGQPPLDPLLGFLPPNRNPPEGEGWVSFSVMPRPGLATGTAVVNAASIVFDANAPIATPPWLNTLDNDAPESAVAALPALSACRFDAAWSGTDAGSGLEDYQVWTARDGAPFERWLHRTASTGASLVGERGAIYALWSVARDRVDNREVPPLTPDAVTTVDPSVSDTPPGDIGNTLGAVKEAAAIRFRWSDAANAEDYLLLTDLDKDGGYTSTLATARDGAAGVDYDAGSSTRFFRVAGRSACGAIGSR